MHKKNRILFSIVISALIVLLYVYLGVGGFIQIDSILNIGLNISAAALYCFLINELVHWIKRGKRAQSLDFIVLGFIFVTVYIWTNDIMNSVVGAFSIYLLFGIMELKEYEVLNKILLITVVTYNFIFFAGLINTYLKSAGIISTDVVRDTAFSMSIWVMLILGFVLFGRKYLIVFRFMSPQYLSLFLFMIAWLAVRFVSKWWTDITEWIYLLLIVTNWLVYFVSGPILDLMLGIKRTQNEDLLKIVDNVKEKLELDEKIKVGFGQYPILNAMAYGAWFDKRIAIISPTIDEFPKDELTGIVAHELSHTKGAVKGLPDTLMLALISTIQLVIFWALGWPATLYDYTFAPESQPFPIWVFLLLNIAISMILYVFVRVLEGYADLNTKKVGLGNQLAKGLYNLEGFYSSGREIGLDTMLLCDEQLEDYNRTNNYATTAEYLYQNMYNAKWYVLLSNLLNSHPPTYHRIVSMYSDEENQLSPWRESILPFSLMFKSKSKKFSLEFKEARKIYEKMALRKFKSMFNIDDFSEYMNSLNKRELYEMKLNKEYIFIDHYHLEVGIGTLIDAKFADDVSNPVYYELQLKTGNNDNKRTFNSIFTELIPLNINEKYQYKGEQVLNLQNVSIPDNLNSQYRDTVEHLINKRKLTEKDIEKYMDIHNAFAKDIKKNAYYVYASDNDIKKLSLSKEIKFDLSIIQNLVGKDIFLEDGGTLKIIKYEDFKLADKFVDSELMVINNRYDSLFSESIEEIGINEEKSYKLRDLTITKEEFSFIVHNDEVSRIYERELFNYLKENTLRTTFYLKKPINNQETGYIKSLKLEINNIKEDDMITIRTIHNKVIELSLNKIEVVVFGQDTIAVTDKQKMSFGEKIGKRYRKWRKPYSLFYL